MLKKIINNKIVKITSKILEFIVFGSLILYVAFIGIQRVSNNSPIFGYRMFTIATSSMVPVYNVDDVILIKEVDANTLKVDDDITYIGEQSDLAGKIVTHRIIKVDTKSDGTKIFVTKGVANEYEDPSIEARQVYGKVQTKISFITLISKIIHNRFGFFFLIFSPIVIFIFLEIADTYYDIKEEKRMQKEDKSDDGKEE